MANARGEILTGQNEETAMFVFDCPRCMFPHSIQIRDDQNRHPSWVWNGSLELPTFTPSLLVRGAHNQDDICHSFINEEKIQFLGDCTHDLAGQTVGLPDHVEW